MDDMEFKMKMVEGIADLKSDMKHVKDKIEIVDEVKENLIKHVSREEGIYWVFGGIWSLTILGVSALVKYWK